MPTKKGRVVLNRNRTHPEWFNLQSGQRINRRSDCHVRSQRCRHNGIHRRYHARRIHRAAQRPNKLAPRNLGLQYNHAMRRNGAMNGRLARLLPLTRADYLQSSVTTRAARSNRYASPAVQRRLREFLLKHCEGLIRPTQSGKIAASIHGVLRDLTTNC